MRNAIVATLIVLVYGCATSSDKVYETQTSRQSTADTMGELRVEIQSPRPGQQLTGGEKFFVVEGGASNFGGVRYLDLMFVLDSSKSLLHSDPRDYLSAGATGLVESLAPESDIHIGVVGFNTRGKLLLPLTPDRGIVVGALTGQQRSGATDVAAGIRTALVEFEKDARPDSSRVIMLFTDGKSNVKKARQATEEAKAQGVAVHTLLLGSNENGAAILQEIALGTGGSFIQVRDPAKLPEAFLNLRTTGIESVSLRVNDGAPIATHLAGGTFTGSVALQAGENEIVAVATSLNGDTARSVVTVNSGPPNCATLDVIALRNGLPTMSLNERSVEIAVDASRSMWGRMEGEPKMVVAKDILQDMSDWMPGELNLALRAYGHASASELKDCTDSQLLVPFGEENREQVREAISNLRPLGQTPLAYALNQVVDDFGLIRGERAVVLVTDGIESCGGDPVAAARRLSDQNITIHVIGFGLGNLADEDTASLEAIAQASGGRFILAHSAEELKEALVDTVGTPFEVFSDDTLVANSSLGSGEAIMLPGGEYRVQVNSFPPQEVWVKLVPGERVKMTLEADEDVVSHYEQRTVEGYTPCAAPGSDADMNADMDVDADAVALR
jgi:Mg-chelatase subunit ChlD